MTIASKYNNYALCQPAKLVSHCDIFTAFWNPSTQDTEIKDVDKSVVKRPKADLRHGSDRERGLRSIVRPELLLHPLHPLQVLETGCLIEVGP